MVLLSLCAGAFAMTDGTYTAEGAGLNGPVTVQVEIAGDAIASITVTNHAETQGVGTLAIDALPDLIVSGQTLDVDTVAGATITSNAILAAVEDALAQAGGSKDSLTPVNVEKEAVTLEDAKTQVVIAGAGGAGMVAALEAKEKGLDVILVEKVGLVGGTSALSSTALNAGGSSVQMAMDKPFTADDYYKKVMGNAEEEDEGVRVMADLSGHVVDWLIDMGADMSRVINGSQHTPADGSAYGAMLIPVLDKQLSAKGIDVRLNTKATEIIMQDGKAIGLKVETADGSYSIFADAVLLATGGFASSPEKVDEYTPQWSGYPSTASIGATGDGIDMAVAAGATLGNMGTASPQTVAYDTGHGAVSLTNVRYNGAIIVNEEGNRFANELGSTAVLGDAIKSQTGGHAFLVFDQVSVDNAVLMSEYKARGYFTEADSLEALAEKLGINAENLAATVERYRAAVDAGEDPDFGRKDSLFSKIDTAPFYGVLISPANQTTNGGINIDAYCRVLDADGAPIAGLYAAGETTNHKGHGMTVATVLGYLADDTIAADLAK